jgi:hypothetical protein
MMLVERLTFRAKYGRGDELVTLFKDSTMLEQMRQPGTGALRIYTDVTGPMFTVQFEQEVNDLQTYAQDMASQREYFGTQDFQAWFAKMMDCVETGERQLLNVESI